MNTFFIGCWIGGSAVVAAGASAKGYSGLAFFGLSLFASPVVTLFALCFAPAREAPGSPARLAHAEGPYKYCGKCANKVVLSETVCLHCGADVAKIVRLPPPRPVARPTARLVAAPTPRLEAPGWNNVDS